MASGYNSITLVGNVGRDPETRNSATGILVSTISVAYTSRRRGSDGQFVETTNWYRVTAFNKLAEIVQQYVTKGRQVLVVGELVVNTYRGQDGAERQSLDITATEVRLLGKREEGAENGTAPTPIRRNQPRPQPVGVAGAGEDLDDLPF